MGFLESAAKIFENEKKGDEKIIVCPPFSRVLYLMIIMCNRIFWLLLYIK